MKSYRMPVSLNEEDKVFGGVLSARQFISMVGGFLTGGAVALLLPSGLWLAVLKVTLIIMFSGLGAVLSFVTVTTRGLRLDQYLVLRVLSWREPRDYPYRGLGTMSDTGGMRGEGGLLAQLVVKGGAKGDVTRRPGLPRRRGHPRRND